VESKLSVAVDRLVVILCLPFYLIAMPVLYLHQKIQMRRKVRVGLEVTHWPMRDLREDYLVVDTSRIHEQLVGIRRRQWDPRSPSAPSFPDDVEYIPIPRFWVPHPLGRRSA
jgi:hypothetical protein